MTVAGPRRIRTGFPNTSGGLITSGGEGQVKKNRGAGGSFLVLCGNSYVIQNILTTMDPMDTVERTGFIKKNNSHFKFKPSQDPNRVTCS